MLMERTNGEGMIPPWLRSDVIFVHGPNRNKSIIYTERRLPTKTGLREPGSKNLTSLHYA